MFKDQLTTFKNLSTSDKLFTIIISITSLTNAYLSNFNSDSALSISMWIFRICQVALIVYCMKKTNVPSFFTNVALSLLTIDLIKIVFRL